MSSHSKGHLGHALATLSATLVILCAFGTLAAAQDHPAPKVELYGGYSFWYPGADVHGVRPLGLSTLTSRMESNPRGVGVSATYNFNRWLGLTLDASDHWGSGEKVLATKLDDAGLFNVSLGPKVTFRSRHFSPFLEVLVGDHRLMPEAFHHVNKLGLMGGGGLDVNLSRHVALRLFRADYVWSSYRYGPAATTPSTDLSGVRLQSGLNFMFGGEAPAVLPTASCSLQPGEVFPGELVTATASGSNFNPKRTVKYSWSGARVKVTGTNASTQIDTTGLPPDSYVVTANLSDGSKNGNASCSARFAVKQTHPPVISCSPDPGSVRMGGTSTISSNASSPDGRGLTYSYSSSAGNISGNTSSATLDSGGAQPGTITVTCNVSDDRNPALTASSTTTVNVQAPPPPPPPDVRAIERRLAIHSIYFATAKPNVENPDGGLVASQETTLNTLAGDFRTLLQTKPDAHLTLEGHTDPRGSVEYNQALSERRVDRTKRALVALGVPAANIETKAFGKQRNLTDVEVRNAVQQNPELSVADRQRVLNNMNVIILASNRRVDITLSNVGRGPQESVRQFPFNAADSLTLLDTRGGTRNAARTPARKRRNTKKQ
ncbi:MAG TPA: OmpA family protein [Verrucomicrobiae bacterium]|nr:OmpA family protein [Verrucomicrobiae bacterium]